MKKKIILSSFFTIFFFSLFIFIYLKFSPEKKIIEKKKITELTQTENLETENEKIVSSNIIEDVSYSAKDTKGNEYFLRVAMELLIKMIVTIFFKVCKCNYKFKKL